ncbi:hypothetical protein [Helicobacter vulpis]|uniref:hypothetical protein n=1 Tax=Helicobacter vulpis TaxID=2316076 RepID=UPI000EB14986|nr:hypothetical protein [Helicobacter vulpis]
MGMFFNNTTNGWSWRNNTGKAMDLFITITGVSGENTQEHYGVEGQNRPFYYKVGKQGASVRVYTNSLSLDFILVGGKGSYQELFTTGGRYLGWSEGTDYWRSGGNWSYRSYIYIYSKDGKSTYRREGTWAYYGGWMWQNIQNTHKQTQAGQSCSFVCSVPPNEVINFVKMPDNDKYQGVFTLSVWSFDGQYGGGF